ncbi:unnamed protein product [Schistosoma margrebowiei]|uniref:Uncharacterized protein n=1 Tax=Schistosoma margrebowiei TaxID=48269 RepID=A0A183N448_9TREM|nr:unnamed protein product [Schistosoma margrebowiei]
MISTSVRPTSAYSELRIPGNTSERASVYRNIPTADSEVCGCQRYRFTKALAYMFQALQDLLDEEGTTMEDNWKGIREALTSTCQEVLGGNNINIGNLLSIGTLFWIQERKNKKTAINNSRT